MTDQPDTSGSADIPEHLVKQLQKLDNQQLRETIHFAQELLDQRFESIPETLETDNEDIIRIEETPEYTLVVRREPEGAVLYHVRTVPDRAGEEKLDWRYIGPVTDE